LASTGRLYEEFAASAGLTLNREEIKTEFFKVIFGKWYVRESSLIWPGIKKVKDGFPVMAGIIESFKGNALALRLQSDEADAMIGIAVPMLAAELPGVPFLTVHDALAVPASDPKYAKIAAGAIRRACLEKTGYLPLVK
jgi:hypothetical protein